jgi:hypothetical protein
MWLAVLKSLSRGLKGPSQFWKLTDFLVGGGLGVRGLARLGTLEVAAEVVGVMRDADAPRAVTVAARNACIDALHKAAVATHANVCGVARPGVDVVVRIILHRRPRKC